MGSSKKYPHSRPKIKTSPIKQLPHSRESGNLPTSGAGISRTELQKRRDIILIMSDRQPAVYIMTNPFRTTLYIGATRHLPERIEAHKSGAVDGFSKDYRCSRLVHVEYYREWSAATMRERQLKKWEREWKNELIEKDNPTWEDLSEDI